MLFMMSVKWLLGEFNPLTVIVLMICLIYFWHLVFCYFFMFPLIFFFAFTVAIWTVSSLIKYPYKLVWRVYILFLSHSWLTSGLSYSWVHSHCRDDNWSFHYSCCFIGSMCQPTVNHVHSHEFFFLFMISFEIIYSFESETYIYHTM